MKRSVVVASLCLSVLGFGARAAEFSANGTINDSIDARDNYFLSRTPSGYTARPLSRIDLDFLAATPTTRYALNTDYSYYKYFGPGAKDTSLAWGTPADAKFSFDQAVDQRTKYNFVASWSRSDLATTLLQETGVAFGRGTVDTYKFGGGVKRDLTRMDSVSWSTDTTMVSYSDPTQTPYIDVVASASWNRRLSPSTTLSNSVNFDWIHQDDPRGDERLFWTATSQLQSQLTRRLYFTGSVAAIFVNAYQTGSGPAPSPFSGLGLQGQSGASHGWNENFSLRYLLTKDTQLSLTAAQSTTPTTLGQLQSLQTIRMSITHSINRLSKIDIQSQFSRSQVADFFSTSAGYTYNLARKWQTNISYTYSQRNDSAGIVASNGVMVSLKYDFTLYGKPPAATIATASELAQQDLTQAQQALPNVVP